MARGTEKAGNLEKKPVWREKRFEKTVYKYYSM